MFRQAILALLLWPIPANAQGDALTEWLLKKGEEWFDEEERTYAVLVDYSFDQYVRLGERRRVQMRIYNPGPATVTGCHGDISGNVSDPASDPRGAFEGYVSKSEQVGLLPGETRSISFLSPPTKVRGEYEVHLNLCCDNQPPMSQGGWDCRYSNRKIKFINIE
jgi:hypothetical protein